MIQYLLAAHFGINDGAYWMPAGACHRAGHFGPDPLAGMTKFNRL
jgi:hypothetical protein